MQARQILENSSFGPDAKKIIRQAFDEAWATTAENFGIGAQRENASIKLARAILLVARDHTRDAAILKEAALRILKGYYTIL